MIGSPTLPVWRGEIQCRGLGMAVDVFDETGQPSASRRASSSAPRPFPSMPVGFWNDSDGSSYRAAYFERFANVWCHGDFSEITRNDGIVILRTFGRGAESRGRSHRHGRDLPPGREACEVVEVDRGRPGLERTTFASCCSSGCGMA